MRTKEQAVKRAKKVGAKRQERRAKVENKKKTEAAHERNVRKLSGLKNLPKKMMNQIRFTKKEGDAPKAQKVPKQLKPYRITLLQGKVEKLQSGIRALDHSDPQRERLVKRLEDIKKKLGK